MTNSRLTGALHPVMVTKGLSNTVLATLVRALLLAAALSCFGIHLTRLIRRFLATPTSTEISRVSQSFPEVLLCNNFPVTQTNVKRFFESPTGKYLRFVSTTALLKLISYRILNVSRIEQSDVNSLSEKDQETMTKIIVASGPQILFRQFGNKRHVFILDCFYNGDTKCSYENFESFYYREYGNCFKFVGPGGEAITSLDVTLFADMANPSMLNTAYTFFGMSFVHFYPHGRIKWDITPGANKRIYLSPKYNIRMKI